MNLGYGAKAFENRTQTIIGADDVVLPAKQPMDGAFIFNPLSKGWKQLPMGSITAPNVRFNDIGDLITSIELIYNRLCGDVSAAQKRDAEESKDSAFALGVAAATTFMTLAAMVVRYQNSYTPNLESVVFSTLFFYAQKGDLFALVISLAALGGWF